MSTSSTSTLAQRAKANWVTTAAAGLGVLIVALLLASPTAIINRSLGRVQIRDPKDRYLGHGGLNNEHCWTDPSGKTCEDVKIHHETDTAFLACGDPVGRSQFYPPINNHWTSKRKDFREYFLKYDIKGNKTTRMEVRGWDGDLVLHGIDIWRFKDDPSKIHLFAVNHGRKGESITIFSHKLGTNVLEFVKDISHPELKTPNAVTPSGPLSFFSTNDHYYYNGLFRSLEDKYAPFRWASWVIHCDGSGSKTTCRKVSDDLQYANGVLLTEDGKTLLVNDLYEGTTIVYSVDPQTKDLILERKVRLGGTPDNLAEIPTNGDIVVPVFPNQVTLFKRGFGPGGLDYATLCESAVVRLVKAKGYAPELLFWDDGSQLSVLTGAAVDPYNKRLIAGGMFSKAFLVCDISNDRTGVVFG
ncbi:hypothetical protein AYO20_02779 [Fonsecaea nubica]|uniref:Uncharacterized protein n=1 Tax=Fonsecaea nubica TaxID=856822 RepID=A0A178D878_9EURO|nr:hypothetical protein AYO20_02779 [Fonsecaea nubica]OAL37946.1 hypothetical protein AYO20_02779 [Fonsecaea nubica]